ncbi:hypothetical protein [Terriglobus sp. RCC_193]|uniref:hypothetical protein n=1 Tax=Terriglobus sp. RCC_193 TaxID=3239218 RepID=UPI003523D4D8
MSGFPTTLLEIRRAGYKLMERRQCKLCKQPIEHWKTTYQKDIYFDPMNADNEETTPHNSSCPVLEGRRKEKTRMSQPIHQFAAAQNAAVVIVLDRNLHADWSLANDCYDEPLDIHNAITTAADSIVKHIESRFNKEPQ